MNSIFTPGQKVIVTGDSGASGCSAVVSAVITEVHGNDYYQVKMPSGRLLLVSVEHIQPMETELTRLKCDHS